MKTKITRAVGCMATYNKRKNTRQKAIDSIKGQLDLLYVIDNSAEKIDRTDNAKFLALDSLDEVFYMFLLDDDLIYPPDYVEKTIKAIEKYGIIVTYHGRRLIGNGLNYYHHHKSFHCLGDVKFDEEIDVAGTGVTAFKTDYFHPKGLSDAKYLKMSDLVFSLEAAKQNKTIGVIAHRAGWIKPINNRESIFNSENRKCKKQNEIADEIYSLNYGEKN